MTLAQALLHHVAAQVDVAVLEPRLFLDVLVELERDRLRAVQHFDAAREQFDLARSEVRVGRARRPRPHRAGHLDHPLATEPLGLGEDLGRVRIEDDLQQAVAVAQVDENDAAVVATTMDPAGHFDRGSDEVLVDLATVMGTHGHGENPVQRCAASGPGPVCDA